MLAFTISIVGQDYHTQNLEINDEVINRINILCLSENYRECLDSCKHYLRNRYWDLEYEKHPYRDWRKYSTYKDPNDIKNIAAMTYFGCVSAYKYTLDVFDVGAIFDGIHMARTCVAIYNDYIKEIKSDEYISKDNLYNNIILGQRGIDAARIGQHLLSIANDERWGKKNIKWFEDKSNKMFELLNKYISGIDAPSLEDPILEYKINTISSANSFRKGDYKNIKVFFINRIEALKRLVKLNEQNNIYDLEINNALNAIVYSLTLGVVEKDVCKIVGGNYERFCMENLIKLQDMSYYLNGSSRYSHYGDYTLSDIQNSLEDTDCAILHFEAPVASGHLYYQYDLSTRYRNYALIITKNQEIPDVWHRGYINDTIVNNLSKIKEIYPKATRFYYVGTPRMSFIDIAGNDTSIVRLHSLSQLLQERSSNTAGSEVTFIGDLNYKKVGEVSLTKSKGKGDDFGQLLGPAKELAYIKTLYTNVRPICGDDATRNVVASEISRNNGIVHISTHGELFSPSDDFTPEELSLKKNVMDNSCVIISGYNDTPQSSLCYMSGSDVLKIKHINSEVVFLDACMSGKGAIGVSGSVGIAEAFHLIGAKNVICYLEPVGDNVATDFSNRFYLELSKGASCHDAFFRAKKSIKQNIKVVLWE